MFREQFTSQEIEFMKEGGSESERYLRFYINWSLKESYVKALGVGLAYELRHIHFQFNIAKDHLGSGLIEGTAVVYVQGLRAMEWTFDILSIDRQFVMTIARGCLSSSDKESTDENSVLATSCLHWDPLPTMERLNVSQLKIKEVRTPRHEICCCDCIIKYFPR